jgi:hypothetical protein
VNRNAGIVIAAASLLAGLGVALYMNRGARVVLKGGVQKVRLQPVDEKNTIAVLDFRFVNPSNYPFWVREVMVLVETAKGEIVEGEVASDVDIKRVFDYYKLSLGEKYNDSLIIREKFAPHESADRMIAATFPLSEADLSQRRRFLIKVREVDSAAPTEIAESERQSR